MVPWVVIILTLVASACRGEHAWPEVAETLPIGESARDLHALYPDADVIDLQDGTESYTLLIFKHFTRSAIEALVLCYRHEQDALRCRSSQLTAEFTSPPHRVPATELVVSINLESGRRAQVRISSSGSQVVSEPVSAPSERPVTETTTPDRGT